MSLVVLSILHILRFLAGIREGYYEEDSSIQSSNKMYHIPSQYLTMGWMMGTEDWKQGAPKEFTVQQEADPWQSLGTGMGLL